MIEYRLRQNGDSRKWITTRNVLRTHERLTLGYKGKEEDGAIRQRYVRLNSRLELEHLEIYKMFNLSGVPVPRKKPAGQSVVTTL